MFNWKKKPKKKQKTRKVEQEAACSESSDNDEVNIGEWTDRVKPVWRTFPGPKRADVLLRVAMDRGPYAELLAHAKESLDVEVCGVLVGDVCEDGEGLFVHIKATIRGDSAKAGGAHVTYTQETWSKIHAEMEEKYSKRAIVGWYHSHPGFGVTFSGMDEFIQNNFFSGPTQVAMVVDPLGGGEAIGVNGVGGIAYVNRFWVDGRERPAFTPEDSDTTHRGTSAGVGMPSADSMDRLEVRVNQLLQAVEEQRSLFFRFLLTVGMVAAVGVVTWIGYSVWTGIRRDREPPRVVSYIPIPIQLGDRQVLMGVSVISWQVPPELTAAYVELERERREQDQEQRQREDANNGDRADSSASATGGPQPD